jgi:hypothetical protein
VNPAAAVSALGELTPGGALMKGFEEESLAREYWIISRPQVYLKYKSPVKKTKVWFASLLRKSQLKHQHINNSQLVSKSTLNHLNPVFNTAILDPESASKELTEEKKCDLSSASLFVLPFRVNVCN